jgi:enoyl-CoA hydratase/carnithine racemase
MLFINLKFFAKKCVLRIYSGGRLALAIYRCRKPTIVALQGSAVGLGMTLTLPAAIRFV